MRRAPASTAGFAPRRIAVVVTRQIGDVLLTTPLIAAAKRRWPAASIDVLGSAGTLGVVAGNPDVASAIDVGDARRWRERLALARRLWRRWDLALVAEPSDRAHLLGFVAAPVRAGLVPQTKAHAWWKRCLLDHAVTVAGIADRHVAAEKVALVAPWLPPGDRGAADGSRGRAGAVGPGATSPGGSGDHVAEDRGSGRVAERGFDDAGCWPVRLPAARPLPDDVERAIAGGRFVVVHVPSMWRYKQWPVERYRELVAALLGDGLRVVLSGGPSAGDRALVGELVGSLASTSSLVDVCGRLDFGQLAGLLSRAALYVGPDTSVTHLAAASRCATLALFGPTDPARWGPIAAVPIVAAAAAERVAAAAASDGIAAAAAFGRVAAESASDQDAAAYARVAVAAGDAPVGVAPGTVRVGTETADGRGCRSQVRERVTVLQGARSCVPCGRGGCADRNDSPSDCLRSIDAADVVRAARALLAIRSTGQPIGG